MKFFKEFRDFAVKRNVIDLAVGVIIGGAFGKIVTSLVNDMIMPVVGLITGKVDWTNMFVSLPPGQSFKTLADAKAAGVPTLNYGLFITNIIDFVIIALCIFLIIKQVQKFKRQPAKAEPDTKDCPFCLSKIPLKASKCAHCTSPLPA